ncbi:hypothetical protein ACWDR3_04080 [Streptomyces sp. NPDC001002]
MRPAGIGGSVTPGRGVRRLSADAAVPAARRPPFVDRQAPPAAADQM